MFTLCSRNGNIIPIETAAVSVFNIEYTYGFGVYESIRVSDKIPYFSDQHSDRLIQSARVIGLSHPFRKEQITKYMLDLIGAIPDDVYNMKILLIGAREEQDAQLFILPMSPFFPERKWYKTGVATITVPFERPFPKAKTLSMLGSYLAYKKAKEAHCYDALAVDKEGFIREGTRTNFFAVRENTLYKAPQDKILDGVTQQIVIHLAEKNGLRVQEKDIPFSDLQTYDGAFLTSTSAKIIPIRQIDHVAYETICPAIQTLIRLYDTFLSTCGGTFSSHDG